MGEFWDPAALFFCLRYKMIKNRHIKCEILTSLGSQRTFFSLRIQSGICRNYFMEKEMNKEQRSPHGDNQESGHSGNYG